MLPLQRSAPRLIHPDLKHGHPERKITVFLARANQDACASELQFEHGSASQNHRASVREMLFGDGAPPVQLYDNGRRTHLKQLAENINSE